MRFKVKCPEHGQVLASGEVVSDVMTMTVTCGCVSRMLGIGTPDRVTCPQAGHGSQPVVLTEACPGCGRHSETLLGCGCFGVLWNMRSMSVFSRKGGNAS